MHSGFYPPCQAFLLAVGSAMVALKWAPGEQGGEGHLPVALGEPDTVRAGEMGTEQKGRETPSEGAGSGGAQR